MKVGSFNQSAPEGFFPANVTFSPVEFCIRLISSCFTWGRKRFLGGKFYPEEEGDKKSDLSGEIKFPVHV